MHFFCIFFKKNLHIAKKSCTFANISNKTGVLIEPLNVKLLKIN